MDELHTGKSKFDILSPQDTSIPFHRISFVWFLLFTSKCSTRNSSQINTNRDALSASYIVNNNSGYILRFISFLWNQNALVFARNWTPFSLYDSNAITQSIESCFFREVLNCTSWSINSSLFSKTKISLNKFT